MESERSILLQKTMIIAMSLIIITIFSAIYVGKNKIIKTSEIANLREMPEIVTVERLANNSYQNMLNIKNQKIQTKTKYLMATSLYQNSLSNPVQDDVNAQLEENVEKNSVAEEKISQMASENHLQEDISMYHEEKGQEEYILFSDEKKEDTSSALEPTQEETIKAIEDEEVVEEALNDVVSTSIEEQKVNANSEIIEAPEDEKVQEETKYKDVLEVTATAYCLCQKCCGKTPDHPDYGYTATGLKIVPGTGMKVIAVDPTVIPLKSHVYVEGMNGAWDYGYAIAADTGGAIKNHKIDLYMDSHSEALKWGRRTVKVYVLNEES